MKKHLLFFVFLWCSFLGYTQLSNDCSNAITICGDTSISSNITGIGTQEIDTEVCYSAQEENSIWLKVNIANSGTLGFTITPKYQNGISQFDFFIFGPDTSCGNLAGAIRCSTAKAKTSSITGLRSTEFDTTENANGNGFVKSLTVNAGESYYILINRPATNNDFYLSWSGSATDYGSAFATKPSILGSLNDLEVTSLNTIGFFDLRDATKNKIVDEKIMQVSYHETVADAMDNTNALPFENHFNLPQKKRIYVRIKNPNTECFSIESFTVSTLRHIPSLKDYILCDLQQDLKEMFNLKEKKKEALLGFPETEYHVTFHETKIHAEANQYPLPMYYSSGAAVIYARTTKKDDPNLFSISTLQLKLRPLPIVINSEIIQCDSYGIESDGIALFNLDEVVPYVADPSQYSEYEFYASYTDMVTGNNVITGNTYVNTTPFKQTVYVVIRNKKGCANNAKIQLKVANSTIENRGTYYSCSSSVQEGLPQGVFDLESILKELPGNLTGYFYTSAENASLKIDPIKNLEHTSSGGELYFRIEKDNQCFLIERLLLEVTSIGDIEILDQSMCQEDDPIIIQAPSGYDMYNWYEIKANDQEEILLGSEKQISITKPGKYLLEAANIHKTDKNKEEKCSSLAAFNIRESSKPEIKRIYTSKVSKQKYHVYIELLETEDEEERDYVYTIERKEDGKLLKTSDISTLEDIAPGLYTATVTDLNGCGSTSKGFAIIGYPEFFTPNGDGVHDIWKIKGTDSVFNADTDIYIYNKYGQFLEKFKSSDPRGWSGTVNGNPLPSSDYWFSIQLKDGSIYKGHFSLKR